MFKLGHKKFKVGYKKSQKLTNTIRAEKRLFPEQALAIPLLPNILHRQFKSLIMLAKYKSSNIIRATWISYWRTNMMNSTTILEIIHYATQARRDTTNTTYYIYKHNWSWKLRRKMLEFLVLLKLLPSKTHELPDLYSRSRGRRKWWIHSNQCTRRTWTIHNSCTVFIPLSNLINASTINNTSIHSKQNYKIRKRVTFANNSVITYPIIQILLCSLRLWKYN